MQRQRGFTLLEIAVVIATRHSRQPGGALNLIRQQGESGPPESRQRSGGARGSAGHV
ncbi:prepilin-type N-terminal cleavage/methylation domain-containing protein [Klebsiella pneumoniae]|nr:prepilin-type N-terminal cleavage/methylation domain-containing protein [Klebsiella pneumoniae]